MHQHFDRSGERRKVLLVDMTCELDLLDLLCEDGFLTPDELSEEDSSERRAALVRRVIRRSFLKAAEAGTDICRKGMLIVKRLNSLRVWMDLVDEDVHLRAPPVRA